MSNNAEKPDKPDKSEDELTYKERNGTTRVGDFLRDVKGVAPEILNVAGKLTGVEALSYIGDKIDEDENISKEDKALAKQKIEADLIEAKLSNKLAIEREKSSTRRWEADMSSDNKASKNIRPYSLGFLLITTFIFIILDSAFKGFDIKDNFIELYSSLLLTAVNGYFILRTTEKPGEVRKMISKGKKGLRKAFTKNK